MTSKTLKNVSPKASTAPVAAPTSLPAPHNVDMRAGNITRLKNTGNETRVFSQEESCNEHTGAILKIETSDPLNTKTPLYHKSIRTKERQRCGPRAA
jgi:hypothetical protein